MTIIETARNLDSQDLPIAAAWAFEHVLRVSALEPSDYVALAFVYFNACDMGYAAHHRLPQEFVDLAYGLSSETLANADRAYPDSVEFSFWADFFIFILENRSEARDRLTNRLEVSGDLLARGLWGFAFLERDEFQADAKRLLSRCQSGRTSQDRYVTSVLVSRVEKHGKRVQAD